MLQLNKVTANLYRFASPEELGYMAYSGQYEKVHTIFKSIPADKKYQYTDKNILNQAIWGGIEKLKEVKKLHMENLISNEKKFISATLQLFINECSKNNHFPKELFQSIIYWSEELICLNCLDEALSFLNDADRIGASKFPDIQIDLLNKKAKIFIFKGMMAEAYDILSHLAARPYLVSDRKKIPLILFNLSQVILIAGNSSIYKKLLFLGLRYFYTDMHDRRNFVEQIRKTYKSSLNIFFSKEIKFPDKFLYFIHWTYYKLPDFKKIKLGFINKIFAFGILAYVYMLNYIRRNEPVHFKEPAEELKYPVIVKNLNVKPAEKNKRKILITRAMGGIGDLLMMTPGFHSLKKKHPAHEIHLAIPKRYFSLFEGNTDFILKDIEDTGLNHLQYGKWFNFTDCPASRVESKSAPKVKESRIDIFSRALGIKRIRLWKSDKKPRYFINEEEQHFKKIFWKENNLEGKRVIGVQLHSDETYRNYPHMERLVQELSKEFSILLFDGEPIKGCNFPNTIKLDNYSIRNAFALASGCEAIIAPDSSFVHFAASQDIPCVALFGPIDGKVRTKYYKYCRFIDARDQIDCLPCWRNESIPCKLTNMRGSVCMSKIQVNKILEELKNVIALKGLK